MHQSLVEGELFSWARLTKIWRFNTGYYDDLIDCEFYRFPTPLEEALSATRIRPGNPREFLRLGEEYFAVGREADAINALNKALQNNPSSFKNLYIVAKMLKENGLKTQSQAAFKWAIEVAPVYLAGLEQSGKYDQSLEVLKRLALAHAYIWEEGSQAEVFRIFKRIIEGPYTGVEAELYRKIGEFMDRVGSYEDGQRAYAKARDASK